MEIINRKQAKMNKIDIRISTVKFIADKRAYIFSFSEDAIKKLDKYLSLGLENNRVYFIADHKSGYTLNRPEGSKRFTFRILTSRLPEELQEKIPGDYSLQYDKQHKLHYIEWA